MRMHPIFQLTKNDIKLMRHLFAAIVQGSIPTDIGMRSTFVFTLEKPRSNVQSVIKVLGIVVKRKFMYEGITAL